MNEIAVTFWLSGNGHDFREYETRDLPCVPCVGSSVVVDNTKYRVESVDWSLGDDYTDAHCFCRDQTATEDALSTLERALNQEAKEKK